MPLVTAQTHLRNQDAQKSYEEEVNLLSVETNSETNVKAFELKKKCIYKISSVSC